MESAACLAAAARANQFSEVAGGGFIAQNLGLSFWIKNYIPTERRKIDPDEFGAQSTCWRARRLAHERERLGYPILSISI